MNRVSTLGAAVFVAALAFAGCKSPSTPEPALGGSTDTSTGASMPTTMTAGITQDAIATAAEDARMFNPQGMPHGLGFPFMAGEPTGCDYDATTGAHSCPAVDNGHGGTMSRSYTFLDAAGTAQENYDAASTASVHFISAHSRSDTRGSFSSRGHGTWDLVESGMAGAESSREWNGSGSGVRELSGVDRAGAAFSFTSTNTETVANVVVPDPWSRTAYPASGTVTRHLVPSNVTGSGHVPTEITSVLTFNGTPIVTLVVNGVGTTIDLSRPPAHPGDQPSPGHGPGGPGGPK